MRKISKMFVRSFACSSFHLSFQEGTIILPSHLLLVRISCFTRPSPRSSCCCETNCRRGDAVCWYFVVYVIWYFIFAANKDNSINNIVIYDVWISGVSEQSTKGICNLKPILKSLFECPSHWPWTKDLISISIFKREIIICCWREVTGKRQARWWKFLCEASTFNQIMWVMAWCLRGEYSSLALTICPPGVGSSGGRNNTVSSVKKNKTAIMFLWAKVKCLWIEG